MKRASTWAMAAYSGRGSGRSQSGKHCHFGLPLPPWSALEAM
ncbi:MAG: hypothetical protein AAFY29_07230 [Pseudomonadota bacterium]